MPILTTLNEREGESPLSGLAALQREMLHCDALLWSTADPDSNFLKWVKTGIWNRFFFLSTADSYAGLGSKICLDQQLYFKAAHLSTALDFEVLVVQMPVLLKEPMNQLHFVFCLLKQLCFFSYTMIMCVVFCMVSINKSIMLTQKLFIATFAKKEQIITILLYWCAVISVNFYCKLFRQGSRKDILLNHVSFFFFFPLYYCYREMKLS